MPYMPVDHEIRIYVQNGVLSYSHSDKRVHSLDRVRWICATHDYAIQFANNTSPFTPKVLLVSETAGTHTSWYTVKKAKKKLPCKYSVAVYLGGNNPILMDDPQIIIDDGGGGNGKSGKGTKSTKKKTKAPKK